MNDEHNIEIPKHLSIVLLIHFIILLSVGVPILIEPAHFMGIFDIEVKDPTLARASSGGILCAAITSLQIRNSKIYESIPMLLALCYFNFAVGISFVVSMMSAGGISMLNIFFVIFNFAFGLLWLISKDNFERIKEKYRNENVNSII